MDGERRYEAYGKEMLRSRTGMTRHALRANQREMVTDIFRAHVKSYKDLPLNLYHIQWKFRTTGGGAPAIRRMRSREFPDERTPIPST